MSCTWASLHRSPIRSDWTRKCSVQALHLHSPRCLPHWRRTRCTRRTLRVSSMALSTCRGPHPHRTRLRRTSATCICARPQRLYRQVAPQLAIHRRRPDTCTRRRPQPILYRATRSQRLPPSSRPLLLGWQRGCTRRPLAMHRLGILGQWACSRPALQHGLRTLRPLPSQPECPQARWARWASRARRAAQMPRPPWPVQRRASWRSSFRHSAKGSHTRPDSA